METCEFRTQLISWAQIHELPDGWTPRQLLSILASMEVSGVSENDALEMTILALQDHEPDEASDRVLEAVLLYIINGSSTTTTLEPVYWE